MEHPYVEERDGRYYVHGSRVPLDPLIYDWSNGVSPETIRENFPVLTLAEIYGAIAYYLDHRQELDRHFELVRTQEAVVSAELNARNHDWLAELDRRFAALKARDKASAS